MKYKITLNGKNYEVEVEQGEAVLLNEWEAQVAAPAAAAPAAPAPAAVAAAPAAPAPAASVAAGGDIVASPMPGTILSVKVVVGQSVKKGDVLAILEAMKMENEIIAPRDGVIAQVIVTQGTSVETGAPLLTMN